MSARLRGRWVTLAVGWLVLVGQLGCSGTPAAPTPSQTASPSPGPTTATQTPAVTPTAGPTSGPASPTADPRPFAIFVPTTYDGTATPLLLLLHGFGMSGAQMESIFKLEPVAEAKGLLYVHPDGAMTDFAERAWNATDACCNISTPPVDDSGYLRSVIERVQSEYVVDPQRIYLIGVSNGGFMSYRMACDHADLIAAIVSVAGAMYLDPAACAPSEPVTVLEIHGTADETVPWDGGQLIPDTHFPSTEATVADWAAYDRCDGRRQTSGARFDLETSLPGKETQASSFSGCPAGVAVELWTVNGGSHILQFAPDFGMQLADFLLDHPKP